MKKVILTSIILLSILVLILVILLIFLNGKNSNIATKNEINNNIAINTELTREENIEFIEEENPKLSTSKELTEASSLSTFLAIEKCIEKYYSAITEKNDQKIIDMLSKENENYTIQEIEKKVQSFRAREIYYKEINEICEYYVLGDLLWEDYNGIDTIYIIVDVDMVNNTFSIIPTNINISSNNEYFSVLEQLEEIEEKSSIKENDNNKFERKSVQTQEMIEYYLNDYVTMAIYYPEIGYNLLNEEYKTKKFENIEDYKQYVQKNKAKMEYCTIYSYGVKQENDILQYTVIDNYRNTYILQVSDAMQYSIMMDIYTIDLDIVTEKYDNGTDEEKVVINTQKIIEAINRSDFEYVYSKLEEQFKQSNYPNLLEFENKMNSVINGTYYISSYDFSQTENQYLCDIELNGTTTSSANLKMQVYMQLGENRDFTIIFYIEEE